MRDGALPCSRRAAPLTVAALAALAAAAALAALPGCRSSSDSGSAASIQIDEAKVARVSASKVAPSSLEAAVTASNAFALKLYSLVQGDAGAKNLLTSPLSASLALGMTYAGAAGPTATEMAAALQFDPGAASSIFDGQNALSQALASRGADAFASAQQQSDSPDKLLAGDYALQIVNAVWGQSTFHWSAPFLNTLAASYGTGVYLEDFIDAPEPARQAINGWVSDATAGKINNLLPPMSIVAKTRMVLVDALHLKLPWETPFDASLTTAGTFTRGDGATVSPKFMRETETLLYADDGQAQVVALPLSHGQLSVLVALPHDGLDLATYAASLRMGMAALTPPSSQALVDLSLPRTTFTSPTFSLKTELEAMGMIQAFVPGTANFTAMAPPDESAGLFVFDVLQKATLSMQERGVEAAAATAVIVDLDASASVDASTPISMIVNRPYLVSVVDVPTGAILLLGQIEDPTDPGGP
jgi:serpin B